MGKFSDDYPFWEEHHEEIETCGNKLEWFEKHGMNGDSYYYWRKHRPGYVPSCTKKKPTNHFVEVPQRLKEERQEPNSLEMDLNLKDGSLHLKGGVTEGMIQSIMETFHHA